MKINRTRDFTVIAQLNKYVHDLHVSLYPEYFKPYHYEAMKTFFQKIIDKEEFTFLLLEEPGQPIGYAWIEIRNYPETPFKKAYKSIYVHQISISKNQRNKGYGSMLMDEIYHIAKSNEVHKIELDYWTENEIATNFYKKEGFVKQREFVYKNLEF